MIAYEGALRARPKLRKTEVFRNGAVIPLTKVGRLGYLTSGDALNFLRSLSDSIANIVFLDPPFNLGKDYGIATELEVIEATHYERYMTEILSESIRILRPGGALFLYHLPYWASRLAPVLNKDLLFRHWIAIAMKNGFVRGRRLYPAHYALLYFTKGEPKRFSRPRLRPKRCRICDGLIKDYGGYRRIIQKKGINLSDFWDDLSPVRHAGKKHRSANELPLELTNRVVRIAGRRGAMLVDPFAGTGTSLVSAVSRGMTFVANDLAKRSLTICRQRIEEYTATSPTR